MEVNALWISNLKAKYCMTDISGNELIIEKTRREGIRCEWEWWSKVNLTRELDGSQGKQISGYVEEIVWE